MGCVAKTGGSLVEVAFVSTISRPTHPVHEPKAPIQVASLSRRNDWVDGGYYPPHLLFRSGRADESCIRLPMFLAFAFAHVGVIVADEREQLGGVIKLWTCKPLL
jgi:hypothetical protein